ncbi:hypothetical protein JTE90_024187 [Oedothorax gibbosus]|uniref:RdRp catalytic domain-containing protein n=1 Tax=Oedothorax gibbosus TaxID=931172 RepID=A0AAV6UDH8_9ARAC|nr:hypothetical protein JTE90_024187 [Oedothorax gibbosus]
MTDHLRETKLGKQEMMREGAPFFNLIEQIEDPWIVAQVFGAFRHWGHPYVDYLQGLRSLHKRVTENIKIDPHYPGYLASDLAQLVLKDQFQKKKKWFATSKGLPKDSPMKQCIDSGVWPTAKVILDFGPNWHKLELLKCFHIPKTIDLSDLYADKAHSMPLSKVIDHIQNRPYTPIPGVRVMETLLNQTDMNYEDFLQKINDKGLDKEDLVIGLKAKERELKKEGRFFSMMSWNMRLYFVLTEYLIKTFYVIRITMADDMNTMTKKLLACAEGQGLDSYDRVNISSSLDYDKWNNRQRLESNGPVFRVMGQFLGMPELFVYTHIAFQNSLIYYNDRPDLMQVDGFGRITSRDPQFIVCWFGQAGGLEGLRQKGWSILNYLVLMREALVRNTLISFLAQGDNQNIITHYKLMVAVTSVLLGPELEAIWHQPISQQSLLKTLFNHIIMFYQQSSLRYKIDIEYWIIF